MPYKDPEKQKARQKEIERSLEGFLVVKYRGMRLRVEGRQTASPSYFIGREVMSFKAFLEWSLIDENYLRLHREWVQSGYDKKLTPSVDRLDSNVGYILGNIEWVTTAENTKRGREKFWNVKKK